MQTNEDNVTSMQTNEYNVTRMQTNEYNVTRMQNIQENLRNAIHPINLKTNECFQQLFLSDAGAVFLTLII